MTSEEIGTLVEREGDEVLRFAAHFSVYLVPPDVVCLYSEHRKFFLHGELYCALASAIARGEARSVIARRLRGEFPPEKIDEAFQRLIDRRFVASVGEPDDVRAAYWGALGLRPEVAHENLQDVRVRIRSLGVAGAEELEGALRAFGVQVAHEDAAELSVVLVADYLDPRLAELNDEMLAGKQDWLLVQPSGIFPLVGPIFSPGKSACWACLADRMRLNRQVKAFLDRSEARCVAVSPLAENALGMGGVGLAAVEIAKAVASGFRSDLRHHLVSLDLLGSTVARHYAPARPQCPVCGSAELRDPARSPVPIRLRAGGRAFITSGGYRSVAPAETVSRYRKHVSPLTGVVSRLERIGGDQLLDASFVAKHNFSPRPESVEALQAGLSGDSYGKGSTAEQGEASALMEAIERYSGIFQGDEIRTTRRLIDFAPGEAIHPNDVHLFSDAQYGRDGEYVDCAGEEAPRRFDPEAETEWSPLWSLRDQRFKYLPTGLLYFFHEGAANRIDADSNGCAAGNTFEEAVLQGFLELVERDAYAIWWYNRLRLPGIDLDAVGDSYVRDLRDALTARGRDIWALNATSDLGIPVVVAVAHWTSEDDEEHVEIAAGAHFDQRIATLRAMTELNQFMAIEGMKGRSSAELANPVPLAQHAYLLPEGEAPPRKGGFAEFSSLDRREQILASVKLVERHGLDFLVLDQTRPDIQVPTVRVVVPGLRHFYRRFGPGRLYDVPVSLGLRQQPTPEAGLNPLHPRS